MTDANAIATEILRQVAARGADKSICPSEVARALMPGDEAWRRLMGPIRACALGLARVGQVQVLRKGRPVDPDAEVRGVIRIRIPPAATEDS